MYRLNDAEMFYDMAEGQAVVINFVSGSYFGTGNLGSEVLNRILKGFAPQKILAALKAMPECPVDIEDILQKFVDELIAKNIIVEGDTVEGGDEPFAEGLAEGGFVLNVVEYNEVQELILADPIHEVEEEEGWPVMKKEN